MNNYHILCPWCYISKWKFSCDLLPVQIGKTKFYKLMALYGIAINWWKTHKRLWPPLVLYDLGLRSFWHYCFDWLSYSGPHSWEEEAITGTENREETCVSLHHACRYIAGPQRHKISERHFHRDEDGRDAEDHLDEDEQAEDEGGADRRLDSGYKILERKSLRLIFFSFKISKRKACPSNFPQPKFPNERPALINLIYL